MLIVEDDPYRELYFEDSASEADVRPIRADDESGRVVYLSSFSKTLAPGYRVAWIDAPAPLAAKFELAKQAEDLCTGALDQRVIYEATRRGVLERQLPILRRHYQAKRDVMVDGACERNSARMKSRWPAPRGGFFLWATLPAQIDADNMIARSVERGVIYVAGSAFFVDGGGHNIIRLAFSAPSHEKIREGVARLAAVVRGELAVTALASAVGFAAAGEASHSFHDSLSPPVIGRDQDLTCRRACRPPARSPVAREMSVCRFRRRSQR